jgi:uridine phosphorylase
LVIADAAVRDDGVTAQMVYPEYPAFATPEVVLALQAVAQKHSAPAHRGVVWTRAAFSPAVRPLPTTEYIAAGVIAIEMELATLLVFAALRGLRAGGALVIDGNATSDNVDPTGYDPHREVVAEGVRRGALVALDGLVDVKS